MFRHVRAGQSLRPGLKGVGSRERASKLRWSLSEALREKDAKFVVNEAQCLWIARDARQSRLLFRLRAVGFRKQRLTLRAGISGQTKSFGTGAANIVLATNHVLRRFLTAGLNKPDKNGAGPSATLSNSHSHTTEQLSVAPSQLTPQVSCPPPLMAPRTEWSLPASEAPPPFRTPSSMPWQA